MESRFLTFHGFMQIHIGIASSHTLRYKENPPLESTPEGEFFIDIRHFQEVL
jgi:hypothetical protein